MAETLQCSATAAAAMEANVNDPLYTVDEDKRVFYLNITILDATEAIKDKVYEKITGNEKDSAEAQSSGMKGRIAGRIANRASQKVTPSKMAPKMAEKMTKLLPLKMRQKGIKVAVNEAFVEGPYFVLELQVQHVNIDKVKESMNNPEEGKDEGNDNDEADLDLMIAQQKIKDKEEELAREKAKEEAGNEGYISSWVNWGKAKAEETALPAVVKMKMESTLAEVLKKQMAEKNIHIDSAVLPEETQARYLFKQMKILRPKETSK